MYEVCMMYVCVRTSGMMYVCVFIASRVIVGMDSANPRPRIPGSIPWYWPQRAIIVKI